MSLAKLFAKFRRGQNVNPRCTGVVESAEINSPTSAVEAADVHDDVAERAEINSPAPPSNDSGHLAICAIMKNEAPNLAEWIAYHHVMGVEKFFLYDNESTDDTRELLAPLIARGLVDYTYWEINPGQLLAYDDCAARAAGKWDWCAFIDLDEFINPFAFENIPAWLSQFSDKSGVAIQWLNFGPNGHKERQPLTIESYTTRCYDMFNIHGHVKSIIKLPDYIKAMGPHSFEVRGDVVDEHGDPVLKSENGEYAIQPIIEHSEVCLNHYYTRSAEDWDAKIARGRADTNNDDRQATWFQIFVDAATTPDMRILPRLPAVKDELERIEVQRAAFLAEQHTY